MSLPLNQREQFLADHPDWSLDGEVVSRTFTFKDFVEAMGFVTSVAIASERVNHHPDIDIRWSKVTIGLTTHEAGALTAKDTDLAAEIDAYARV